MTATAMLTGTTGKEKHKTRTLAKEITGIAAVVLAQISSFYNNLMENTDSDKFNENMSITEFAEGVTVENVGCH